MKYFFSISELKLKLAIFIITCSFLAVVSIQAVAEDELIEFWSPSKESNTTSINHDTWQEVLDRYLISDHESGINRFDYERVTSSDKKKLEQYLIYMQSLDPRNYARATQMAYWINLYNALTIKVILDDYPVDSIKEAGGGFFDFGPWDDKVAIIQGERLTLNDIEHGILRPLWKDNRIHYAVNCASISCPNLSERVFTASNVEQLLEHSAKTYVNHSRGVNFIDGQLTVSSIYIWYIEDFGGNEDTLLAHLRHYAEKPLKEKLQKYQGDIDHDYDWQLNQPKQPYSAISD